jgi:ParB/RepB/Spo0J family partition protein
MNKRVIEEIPLESIEIDTYQPRQVIEDEKLNDLKDDIKEVGLQIPIILTPCFVKDKETIIIGKDALRYKHKWFLVDGYRRYLCCKSLHYKKIEAELRYELTGLEAIEMQFRVNGKRVQVTVKEMARAIERFAKLWKEKGMKGDIIDRLSKLTGYSTTYFHMAKCIVDEKSEVIKKLVDEDKIGAYYCAEKKASTKNKSIQEGMDEAIKDYVEKNPDKKVGALTPRVMKPEFKKIEKMMKNPKEQRIVAKAKTLDYLNRTIESLDETSNYEKYLYEAEKFYQEVLKWNLQQLTVNQVEKISESIMKSVIYLREEKRKLNKFKNPKRKGRNM